MNHETLHDHTIQPQMFIAFSELADGPIQRDEAIFLYGFVRISRPRVIVEFGFLRGASATLFLGAMEPESRLFSFDNDPDALNAERGLSDFRFQFVPKPQEDFTAQDIGGFEIDLAFVDAGHTLASNCEMFSRILPSLSETATLAIHDTGTWNKQKVPDFGGWQSMLAADNGHLSTTEFAHRPDERRFVNWILDQGLGFGAVHLHTLSTVRHGLTLMQRHQRLPV